MSVKYRVIHARSPWRRVNSHSSVQTALSGPDGARNLLLKKGRVGEKIDMYGDVAAVFVWDPHRAIGYALRLAPGAPTEVQQVEVDVNILEKFDANDGCSMAEIAKLF